MKLRNKKTGKIIEGKCFTDIISKLLDNADFFGSKYLNLNLLNEYWEEYEEKEPLIEHDDARKAFFNWASTNQVHRVKCDVIQRNGVPIARFTSTEYISEPSIEFKLLDANVKDGCEYAIEELCGKDEE